MRLNKIKCNMHIDNNVVFNVTADTLLWIYLQTCLSDMISLVHREQ